jgi:hypothetical protein
MSLMVLAHHEAAHAVIAARLGLRITRAFVSAEGGAVEYADRPRDLDTLHWPIVILAGPIAEAMHKGAPFALEDIVGSDDYAQVLAHATATHGPDDAAARIERVQALAGAHVVNLWPIIQRVAAALVRSKELSGAQLAPLLLRRASDR